jgi:hypothetical protein
MEKLRELTEIKWAAGNDLHAHKEDSNVEDSEAEAELQEQQEKPGL